MKYVYVWLSILFFVQGISYITGKVVVTGFDASVNSFFLAALIFATYLDGREKKS